MIECKVCEKVFLQKEKEKCCSKRCSGQLRNPRFLRLKSWFNQAGINIEALVKKGYCSGMVFDLLVRDYSLPSEFTLQQIRDLLKSQFKFDNVYYNKQPQAWKLQFKYPAFFTREEVEKDINEKCGIGASKTHKIRELKGNTGNIKFKKEDSPLCMEFYVKRKIPESLAKEKMLGIVLAGSYANLKNKENKFENRIESEIKSLGFNVQRQYRIFLLDEEKKYNKKSYVFDFYIPEKNLLLECQGIFWHASPLVYRSGDKIKLPRFGLVEVDKIWEMDEFKKQIALKRGFDYITVWENENLVLNDKI